MKKEKRFDLSQFAETYTTTKSTKMLKKLKAEVKKQLGSPFYCQRDIEGESICDKQCKHCKKYYKPLEE